MSEEAVGVDGAQPPTVGESGIAGPGADLTRLTLHEVTHGSRETLHRWLQLDDGQQQLAVVSAPFAVLREHTPPGNWPPSSDRTRTPTTSVSPAN
ncbi:hypothetical protein [Streptomyces collinus]|uniref:hypothetical protein n=1 Tax=Streptomyces collinus TaxID=42684 RepID=UPI002943EE27|nr:hypothetical protein [Streptomyces collinus]